jgi:hypothetical protein
MVALQEKAGIRFVSDEQFPSLKRVWRRKGSIPHGLKAPRIIEI